MSVKAGHAQTTDSPMLREDAGRIGLAYTVVADCITYTCPPEPTRYSAGFLRRQQRERPAGSETKSPSSEPRRHAGGTPHDEDEAHELLLEMVHPPEPRRPHDRGMLGAILLGCLRRFAGCPASSVATPSDQLASSPSQHGAVTAALA